METMIGTERDPCRAALRGKCSRCKQQRRDRAKPPAVLLVHGFPELAFSWRKVMLPIAAAGYHVIAPDLRGYGRSGGTDVKFDDDLAPWRTLNEVTDMVALVSAFGYKSMAA